MILKKTNRLLDIAIAILMNSLSTTANAEPNNVDSADVVVAADGSGNYTTVQEAINMAPSHATKQHRILVKSGKYLGPFLVPPAKNNIKLIGSSGSASILTYSKNVKEPEPGSPPIFAGIGVVVQADDFSAENITFENTSGDHGQALALRVDADRACFKKCRILGWQDTLMANKGRQIYQECYIEGRVDFIYGDATAVFDQCTIHSKNGGYITAASTPQDQSYGFVFFDCKLTGDEIPWIPENSTEPIKPSIKPNTFLGRPWRPYASVIYVRCEMGDHIQKEGWHNWGKETNEVTARYYEIDCFGPGADIKGRVPWSKQLDKNQRENLIIAAILRGMDSWEPQNAKK
jgi:pectinesterase